MPYSRAFDDHFYCRNDGRLECGHVFLAGNGLPDRWQRKAPFRIAELGFGTYAAAGFVRRNLAAAGFVVERRPGFAGKREMLCGERPAT